MSTRKLTPETISILEQTDISNSVISKHISDNFMYFFNKHRELVEKYRVEPNGRRLIEDYPQNFDIRVALYYLGCQIEREKEFAIRSFLQNLYTVDTKMTKKLVNTIRLEIGKNLRPILDELDSRYQIKGRFEINTPYSGSSTPFDIKSDSLDGLLEQIKTKISDSEKEW